MFAGVDGELVHGDVPLGLDEVELLVVPEGSPLGVDDHVLLAGEVVLVDGLNILDVLQVAGVSARAENQANSAPVVFPCAAAMQ